ncbi:MAG: IgGFc-binding protein [Chloroflexi bacterium]|nr:IgGFc-binding protein [Chloroflexota bacterium]
MGIDQSIPEPRLGSEYILMQGEGGNGILETPIVIATSDSTQVTVNGNTTPICTLNSGDYGTGIGIRQYGRRPQSHSDERR